MLWPVKTLECPHDNPMKPANRVLPLPARPKQASLKPAMMLTVVPVLIGCRYGGQLYPATCVTSIGVRGTTHWRIKRVESRGRHRLSSRAHD
jgi:hypothetical protein